MKPKKLTLLLTSLCLGLSLIQPTISVMASEKSADNATTTATEAKQERKVIGYFTEWAYADDKHNNYTADQMPWDKLTHINYAFAQVNEKTNKIDFGNKEAAIEKEFPGQTKDFPYKGHFNVINSYKKKYPNVKSLISVGGWATTRGFYTMTDTAEGRETFANSCVDFIKEYGFDGVDIDYEYPTSTVGAGNPEDFDLSDKKRADLYNNYVELMKTLREKLDAAGKKDNKHYLLTAALPASSWILGGMGLGEYNQYLDYVNLMSYDFHGAWNGVVGHNSALYPDERDPESKDMKMAPFNTDWAVRYFSGIMSPEKINIGVPYYTRGWQNVTPGTIEGGLYGTGAKTDGGATGEYNLWHDLDKNGKEVPAGSNPLWHAKNLIKDGKLKRYFDDVSKVPYLWNDEKKIFLSYEDEESLKHKVDYVVNNNLGGIMIWELDGDYKEKADGSFTVGNTLTSFIYDSFAKAPAMKDEIKSDPKPSMDYKVDFSGKYDHPNYQYSMKVTNNTKETIPAGWKLQFDFPKSCIFNAPWGVTYSKVSEGTFSDRYEITGPGWKAIAPGETYEIQGTVYLCFTGGPKNFTLNGYTSQAEVGIVEDTNKPAVGELVASATDSKDGNYDITLNIPKDSKAKSYKIYENNKAVKSGDLATADTQVVQNVKNKAAGTYTYKAELINESGKTETKEVIVKVTREGGATTSPYKVDFKTTADWGSGANFEIVVTNNSKEDITDWKLEFTFDGELTSLWGADLKALGNNKYVITANQAGKTIAAGTSYKMGGGAKGGISSLAPYEVKLNGVAVD